MSKLYVLTASSGSYDDYHEENICASLDKTVLELRQIELEERDGRWAMAEHAVINFYNQWIGENPFSQPVPAMPEYPKGPMKPTKDTINEHRRIVRVYQKEAERVNRIIQAVVAEREARAAEAQKAFALTVGLLPEDLEARSQWPVRWRESGGVSYSIEELELI